MEGFRELVEDYVAMLSSEEIDGRANHFLTRFEVAAPPAHQAFAFLYEIQSAAEVTDF